MPKVKTTAWCAKYTDETGYKFLFVPTCSTSKETCIRIAQGYTIGTYRIVKVEIREVK